MHICEYVCARAHTHLFMHIYGCIITCTHAYMPAVLQLTKQKEEIQTGGCGIVIKGLPSVIGCGSQTCLSKRTCSSFCGGKAKFHI